MDDLDEFFFNQRANFTQVERAGPPAVLSRAPDDGEDLLLSQAFRTNSGTHQTSGANFSQPPPSQRRQIGIVTPSRTSVISRLSGRPFQGQTYYNENSLENDQDPANDTMLDHNSRDELGFRNNNRSENDIDADPNPTPKDTHRMSQEQTSGRRPRNGVLSTPQTLVLPRCTPGGSELTASLMRLKPVTEIPEAYRQVFPFPYFNVVQSRVLDDALYTDRPLVLCAPTGSGKTAIFELAIIRMLMKKQIGKVVYMAPMKALCSERYEDWSQKFGPLGMLCKQLTGDTELDDYFEFQDVHVILTTPEKWDSMTRRWRDNRSLVQQVALFLIDEVHMLNDCSRGATMEAVVSRMKTVQTAMSRERHTGVQLPAYLRLIAVSATIPNVEDVACWLGNEKSRALHHSMDDSCRPVRLRKVVLGFPCSQNQSEFRFDLSLNYKLAHVIETYSENKPTLVFAATRKSVTQAATTVVKDARFFLDASHKLRLQKCANSLRDAKLRELVLSGVAYHHAGLDMQDRKAIEAAFTCGDLPVLVATSTLAMGVNLPAHLVIIKSTLHYAMGVYQEYTETQILQMIGRAGRPQFDTTATAVIMTRMQTKLKYESLVNGTQFIESSLHQNLVEHLNAEIVLNTISDVSVALEWLQSTFLYIRVVKNPKYYGLPEGLTQEQINNKLQDLCMENLNKLGTVQLVTMDSDGFLLKSTELGRLMARYCVAFETMKKFKEATKADSLNELLGILCSSQEFRDIQLRTNEKKTLNTLNKDKNRLTIRFELPGKIKTSEMKVNCLIQAQLGCLTLQDFALSQDLGKIFRSALRISKCLVEVQWQEGCFSSLLNAALLGKAIKAKLWENSKHVARQLPGIGPTLSMALVNAGVTSFQQLEDKNPREIELIVNRHPPFGNQIKDTVSRLPKYELCLDQSTKYSVDQADITLSVSLTNTDVLTERSTAGNMHMCLFIVGDADNNIVFKAKISDRHLMRGTLWTKRVNVKRAKKGPELSINLVSQDFVGLDVQSSYTPFYTGVKRLNYTPSESQAHPRPPTQEYSKKSQGPYQQIPATLAPDRRPCSHSCLDKQSCAHDCCKHGVPVKATRATPVDRLRQQLKHHLADMPQTPSFKRPKSGVMGTPLPNLQQYAYQPKKRLSLGATVPNKDCFVGQDPGLEDIYSHEDFQENGFVPNRQKPTVKHSFWASSNDLEDHQGLDFFSDLYNADTHPPPAQLHGTVKPKQPADLGQKQPLPHSSKIYQQPNEFSNSKSSFKSIKNHRALGCHGSTNCALGEERNDPQVGGKSLQNRLNAYDRVETNEAKKQKFEMGYGFSRDCVVAKSHDRLDRQAAVISGKKVNSSKPCEVSGLSSFARNMRELAKKRQGMDISQMEGPESARNVSHGRNMGNKSLNHSFKFSCGDQGNAHDMESQIMQDCLPHSRGSFPARKDNGAGHMHATLRKKELWDNFCDNSANNLDKKRSYATGSARMSAMPLNGDLQGDEGNVLKSLNEPKEVDWEFDECVWEDNEDKTGWDELHYDHRTQQAFQVKGITPTSWSGKPTPRDNTQRSEVSKIQDRTWSYPLSRTFDGVPSSKGEIAQNPLKERGFNATETIIKFPNNPDMNFAMQTKFENNALSSLKGFREVDMQHKMNPGTYPEFELYPERLKNTHTSSLDERYSDHMLNRTSKYDSVNITQMVPVVKQYRGASEKSLNISRKISPVTCERNICILSKEPANSTDVKAYKRLTVDSKLIACSSRPSTCSEQSEMWKHTTQKRSLNDGTSNSSFGVISNPCILKQRQVPLANLVSDKSNSNRNRQLGHPYADARSSVPSRSPVPARFQQNFFASHSNLADFLHIPEVKTNGDTTSFHASIENPRHLTMFVDDTPGPAGYVDQEEADCEDVFAGVL